MAIWNYGLWLLKKRNTEKQDNLEMKIKFAILMTVAASFHYLAEAATVKPNETLSLKDGKQPLVVSSSKPNIVFLIADDERWDMMGCSGNK